MITKLITISRECNCFNFLLTTWHIYDPPFFTLSFPNSGPFWKEWRKKKNKNKIRKKIQQVAKKTQTWKLTLRILIIKEIDLCCVGSLQDQAVDYLKYGQAIFIGVFTHIPVNSLKLNMLAMRYFLEYFLRHDRRPNAIYYSGLFPVKVNSNTDGMLYAVLLQRGAAFCLFIFTKLRVLFIIV